MFLRRSPTLNSPEFKASEYRHKLPPAHHSDYFLQSGESPEDEGYGGRPEPRMLRYVLRDNQLAILQCRLEVIHGLV